MVGVVAVGLVPLTVVVAAYWWAPPWPEVKRELARDRAAPASRAGRVGPFHTGDRSTCQVSGTRQVLVPTRGAWVTGDCCGGGASAQIRVLVVDDHPEVRRTLTEALSDEDDLTVVGECDDGSQVVEAATRLRPDVVFMDLSMPVMGGLAATEALRASHPGARVIVLTGEGSDARPEAVVAGAHALVPKGARLDALLRCLRTVAVGGTGCPYCL